MNTPREVRWERMFPDELEQAFAACPLVYFAYGLCEPHGPQNAVGLDSLKAHSIACATARAHGGVVAPPDYWHIHEIGGYASWAHRSVGQVERTWGEGRSDRLVVVMPPGRPRAAAPDCAGGRPLRSEHLVVPLVPVSALLGSRPGQPSPRKRERFRARRVRRERWRAPRSSPAARTA